MRPGLKTLVGIVTALAVTATATPAEARPGHRHSPAEREEMLRKINTMKVVELGQLLELDTAGTIKLSARLKPFDEKRTKLRLESFEAMKTLRQARRGDASADAVAAARTLARNRVKLSEVDEQELQEVLKGLSGEKATRAAVFMTQFPRRIERMAGKMHERRRKANDKD